MLWLLTMPRFSASKGIMGFLPEKSNNPYKLEISYNTKYSSIFKYFYEKNIKNKRTQ